MRILICDDDVLITEQLTKYIHEFFSFKNLKQPEIISFDSGETLLQDTGMKDIVFLDIEMPGVSGIYTGKELKKINPNIIIFIITSFAEYLDEAMRSNMHSVRIIHGKGTGVLRSAVHSSLKKNRFIKSFRLGLYGEGEDGVTIVEFK